MTPAEAALDERRTDILTFAPNEVLDLFTRLVTIRVFEERVETAHKAGQLYGPFHSSVGQEAVAVGACAVLQPHDVGDEHPPRSRPRHRQGWRPVEDVRRAVGAGGRVQPRQGWIDAPGVEGARADRPERHRRRQPVPCRRCRPRARRARPRRRRRGVQRRRQRRPRRLPRDDQPGGDLEAAGRLRDREQRLCPLDARRRDAVGSVDRHARRRVRHSRRPRRRQRRARRPRGDVRRRRRRPSRPAARRSSRPSATDGRGTTSATPTSATAPATRWPRRARSTRSRSFAATRRRLSARPSSTPSRPRSRERVDEAIAFAGSSPTPDPKWTFEDTV